MAHDWIKMRTGIDRDPRVIAMAERLSSSPSFARYMFGSEFREQNATCSQTVREQFANTHEMFQDCFTVFQRNIIVKACVSALLTIWGVVRDQGKDSDSDARLDMSNLRTLDQLSEIPGFGDAMAYVGWVRYENNDGQNHLIFPGFLIENKTKSGNGGGDRAAYQKAYRARKKAEQAAAQSPSTPPVKPVANVFANSSQTVLSENETTQKTQNREEEKRIDKGINTFPTEPSATVETTPITTPPQLDSIPEKPAKGKAKADPKPRQPNELFDAICEVTGSLPVSCASHVQKICTGFKQESPPITPEEVREFGRRFYELCPWAESDSRPKPTLGELQKNIGKLRSAPGAFGPHTNGKPKAGTMERMQWEIDHMYDDVSPEEADAAKQKFLESRGIEL